MPNFKDLTGKRYGRLTVISLAGKNRWGAYTWLCQCSCTEGNKTIVPVSSLTSGNSTSCGCLARERAIDACTKHGYAARLQRRAEYSVYYAMIQRCYNPKNPQFIDYGGRGITVSDRWKQGFEFFLEDVGHRPSNKYSIERKDNNGPYSKENCEWATIGMQSRNNRRNVFVNISGEKLVLIDALKKIDLGMSKYFYWRKRGMKPQEIIDAKVKKTLGRPEWSLTFNGQTHTGKEWAAITGIPYHTIFLRINRLGWTIERALTEPVQHQCGKN